MKNTLVAASLIPVLAFALATAALIAGLISLRFLDVTGLVGTLVAAGVLAFALCDYTRKPSFRVRRSRQSAAPAQPVSNRAPALVKPDWTYRTISA